MANPLQILKSPLITEKGTLVAETGHVVFKVPPHATKGEIRRAVEALFSVKVSSVHTARTSMSDARAADSRHAHNSASTRSLREIGRAHV